MIFGEYNEALDRQAAEDYAREQREIGEKEGIKQGVKQGEKQKAVQFVKSLLKESPEWPDQKIADVVKDITAEEVARLRKGE